MSAWSRSDIPVLEHCSFPPLVVDRHGIAVTWTKRKISPKGPSWWGSCTKRIFDLFGRQPRSTFFCCCWTLMHDDLPVAPLFSSLLLGKRSASEPCSEGIGEPHSGAVHGLAVGDNPTSEGRAIEVDQVDERCASQGCSNALSPACGQPCSPSL
jgi:hypothetical protein